MSHNTMPVKNFLVMFPSKPHKDSKKLGKNTENLKEGVEITFLSAFALQIFSSLGAVQILYILEVTFE